MNDQPDQEQQQMMQQYQQAQQQLEQIQDYIERVEENIEEVEQTRKAVNKLEGEEIGSEVLSPIGSGVMAVTELKENDQVITNIGGDSFEKRGLEEADNILGSRKEDLIETKEELEQSVQELQQQLQQMQAQMQQAQQ